MVYVNIQSVVLSCVTGCLCRVGLGLMSFRCHMQWLNKDGIINSPHRSRCGLFLPTE